MIKRTANFITVLEVITDMGLEPTDEFKRRVSEMVEESYERLIGQPPSKEEGTDTLYLEFWRKKIEDLVRLCQDKSGRR